jgi:uncharacterized protein YgbK (DUF1537 family)
MSEKNKIESLQYSPLGVGGIIAVIADDFTGAAELAGIALQYGLSARLFTNEVNDANADVAIVSTNSRSLNKEDAIAVTEKGITQLIQLNPFIFYKKTDSVLRGYVADELKLQMNLLGLNNALYLPANPSLGRTISNGKYFINDVEVNKTGFAADPEFSIKSSLITDMLKDEQVVIGKTNEEIFQNKIVVGEVSSKKDIVEWLDKADDSFLLAGAGDAFECLLEKFEHKKLQQQTVELLKPHLYVSGTSFNKSVELIKNVQQKELVNYLSDKIMLGFEDENWLYQTQSFIHTNNKVIIAIDNETKNATNISALSLRTNMAIAVKKLIETTGIKEILIEGGSTAASILIELGITEFIPTNELSRGVIRMKAINKDLFITVKPGSYELPAIIKQLYFN